ncbi:hypothetical protein L1987_25329 [Smallanthus sonchifolius]|uniref:Uncharacterized protein n=1 Tax=Smallanthus sonchifolius TaxID=185202 RepID=A0ACB9INI2_9ASTR|nr:hypothetical protein L1987_25329 [Smallanthus sonchifolius]
MQCLIKEPEKPKGDDMPVKPDPSPKSEVARMMVEPPVQGYPQMYPPTYPLVGYGYGYEGYHGMSVAVTAPQSSGYYGFSDDFFSEENPQGCSLM